MRYAEKEFAAMKENGELDILNGLYDEQNRLVDEGSVDERFEALRKLDLDLVDFLGNTRRKNSYFLGKMIYDEIKSNYDIHESRWLQILESREEGSSFLTLDKVRSSYRFRGLEQVKELGLNPKSPAGMNIIKLWDDRGRAREEEKRLEYTFQSTTDNANQSERLFLADPTRDNLNNFVIDLGRIPSKDRNGRISRGIGTVNIRASYEVAIQRLVGNRRFSGNGGFAKFEDEVLNQIIPGKDIISNKNLH